MGIDDGPADRQPHPHAAGLRGVESLEHALALVRNNSRSRITHGDNSIRLLLLGADHQLSRPIDRAHCLDRVQDQIQDDLLQLNTIPLNGKQLLRKPHLERNPMLGNCAPRQFDYLGDRLIKIKPILSRRRFLGVSPDTVDDVAGSISVAHDTPERFSDFVQIWPLLG
jgi:hypothetical protein